MYLNFYELDRKPFQISTDPHFLWMSEKHKEALAMLKYGIMDNRGFILLTGNVGTGKTTLVNSLTNSLGSNIISATITDPGLEQIDFFNYLADAFALNATYAGKGEFLIGFRRFLQQSYRDGKQVLLIIDEAQHLSPKMLEEIRLLSNIERQDVKLLNIFLVGQDELNEILDRHENRPLRQRMTLHYHLEALTEGEIDEMIRHRLKVAGTVKKIFTGDAVHEIHEFSRGYPRLVNIICDHALLAGYVAYKKIIDAPVIRECVEDLKLPRGSEKSIGNGNGNKAPAAKRGADRRKAKNKTVSWILKLIGGALVFMLAYFFYVPIRAGLSVSESATYWHGKFDRFQYAMSAMDEPRPQVYPVIQKVPSPEPESSKASSDIPKQEPVLPVSGQGLQGMDKVANLAAKVSESVSPEVKTAPIASEQPTSSSQLQTLSSQHPDRGQSASQLPSTSASQPSETHFMLPFEFDSNDLSPEGYARLNQTADLMARNPNITLTIRGYTDAVGNKSYNIMLSKFRADIVKNYLISKGIDPNRITSIGKGDESPIESNESINGRQANRRVEVDLAY